MFALGVSIVAATVVARSSSSGRFLAGTASPLLGLNQPGIHRAWWRPLPRLFHEDPIGPRRTSWTSGAVVGDDHVARRAPRIPEPIVCTVAVTGAHLRMLEELSNLYHVDFSPKKVRILLIAATGGALTDWVLGWSAIRRVVAAYAPIILPIWFVGGSILAGSLTHFMGHAFIRHYENGGTYQTFDWAEFRRELLGKFAPLLPRAPATA